ncbi:unnamed protein product [Colias eurytheme]|nr:unnamed protein product [Colias eurytheme]
MTRRATNMFVCITLNLFDWVTHTGARLPRAGALWGRTAPLHARRRQMATHTRARRKGKLHCVNKSRERVLSLSVTKPAYGSSLCAVDTNRSRLFCEIAR